MFFLITSSRCDSYWGADELAVLKELNYTEHDFGRIDLWTNTNTSNKLRRLTEKTKFECYASDPLAYGGLVDV